MYYILQIAGNLLYLISLLYIAEKLLLLKRKEIDARVRWLMIGWMFAFVVIGILKIDLVYTFAGLALMIGFLMQILYQGRKTYLLLYELFAIFFLSLANEITLLLFQVIKTLFHIDPLVHDDSMITNLSISVFTIIFLFLISNIFWQKYSVILSEITIVQLALMTVVVCIDEVMVAALFYIRDEASSSSPALDGVCFLMSLGLYLQLGLLLPMIASIVVYQQKLEISHRYLEEQVGHYKDLEEQNKNIRKFRHDMRNHMMTLHALYQKGEKEEFENYLEEINGKIEELRQPVYLNNSIAEAVVNRFLRLAGENHISLIVKGKFPEECFLTGMEICTILSNLLSNAMEAVQRCRGEKIALTFRYEDDEIYLQMENDCDPSLKFSGGHMSTGKADKQSHGFGLENIEACVKKHRGWMYMEAAGGVFRTVIELKNEKA